MQEIEQKPKEILVHALLIVSLEEYQKEKKGQAELIVFKIEETATPGQIALHIIREACNKNQFCSDVFNRHLRLTCPDPYEITLKAVTIFDDCCEQVTGSDNVLSVFTNDVLNDRKFIQEITKSKNSCYGFK